MRSINLVNNLVILMPALLDSAKLVLSLTLCDDCLTGNQGNHLCCVLSYTQVHWLQHYLP